MLEGVDDVWIDEAKNVVCRFGPTSCDSYVVFAAHMDVVFDDTEPLPMRREGSRLFAPGIGDDTASQMRQVVNDARSRGVQLHVSTVGVRPGASPELDRSALRSFTDGNIEVIRSWFDGGIDETPYGTDSNWPLSLGVLANTIGTVPGEYAHTRRLV